MAIAVGWKSRIGLVLSAIWLCLVLLVSDDYRRISQTLGFGFLPLVILWGIAWAVSGWRAQRPKKVEEDSVVLAETNSKRRAKIRTTLGVLAILIVGCFAAVWQFRSAENMEGEQAIAAWFGEWLVYGLFVYGLLRLVPKLPYGTPIILAAVFVVGVINWKAFSAIAEDRQILASLARAAPVLSKVQSGVPVSDKEVRDANVGVLEPLMLAQAAYGREVIAISATYDKAMNDAGLELMLAPHSLESSTMRMETRARLKMLDPAIGMYKTQFDSATARMKLATQAALKQMPAGLARETLQSTDRKSIQLTSYVNDQVAMTREVNQKVVAILDLLETNPGSYVFDKGPPPRLLFRTEATLRQYQTLFNGVLDISKRSQEAQARLIQEQSTQTDKLTEFLKK